MPVSVGHIESAQMFHSLLRATARIHGYVSLVLGDTHYDEKLDRSETEKSHNSLGQLHVWFCGVFQNGVSESEIC